MVRPASGSGRGLGRGNTAGNLASTTRHLSTEAEEEKDEGPEEGEVLLDRSGLASLLEDEVGLWTTDAGDEEIEQLDSQNPGKGKRGGGLQRKLAKKALYRKRRAEKERQMGLRPSKRVKLSEPPRKLCTFFLKGRCAKGKDCTFSHDCVPVTKSEPCKFLTMACCLKGDDCPFSHDLASFPCKYFHTRGFCFDGVTCRFSHAPITEEDRKKLMKRVDQETKDRHLQQEKTTETGASDVPSGYTQLSDDLSSVQIESGSNLEAASESQQLLGVASEEASCHVQSISGENVPSFASKSDDPGNTGDPKEDENFVLVAARKAAAAAVAGQHNAAQDRGLALRRSRGFEGSAMELLKATLKKEVDDSVPQLTETGGNCVQSSGSRKPTSAMAFLEEFLKDEVSYM